MTSATQPATESVAPVRLSSAEVVALVEQPDTERLPLALDRLLLSEQLAASVVPSGDRTQAVGRVLRAAARWVEIGWSVGDRRHVLNIVGGAGIVLVIGRPGEDEFEFLAVNRGRPVGEAVVGVLRSIAALPEMVVVNAVGFGGPSAAVLGVLDGQQLDLLRWDENPIPPGVVAAMTLAAAPPGPAWTAIGSGTLADLIGAVALIVDQPGPAPAARMVHR